MYDGSHLDIADNIANTRKVIDIARHSNISVEAELGAIGSIRDGKAVAMEDICFTTTRCRRFVDETGVDILAVSVGTVHGLYTGKAKIQHQRLADISEVTKTPLVLHGGTGVSVKICAAPSPGALIESTSVLMNVQWVGHCKRNL